MLSAMGPEVAEMFYDVIMFVLVMVPSLLDAAFQTFRNAFGC